MNVLINQIINTFFTFALLAFIPFIWYLINYRKLKGLGNYLGFTKPPEGSFLSALKFTGLGYCFSLMVIVILIVQSGEIMTTLTAEAFETGSIFIIIVSVLLIGIKTGISEELLFRGFIGKLLIKTFGFKIGNLIQSIIFVLPHYLTFTATPKLEFYLMMLNSGVMGYIFGFITEKKSNGSIIPAIFMHGLVNITSAFIFFFLSIILN